LLWGLLLVCCRHTAVAFLSVSYINQTSSRDFHHDI
jgi:hypothetical protein